MRSSEERKKEKNFGRARRGARRPESSYLIKFSPQIDLQIGRTLHAIRMMIGC